MRQIGAASGNHRSNPGFVQTTVTESPGLGEFDRLEGRWRINRLTIQKSPRLPVPGGVPCLGVPGRSYLRCIAKMFMLLCKRDRCMWYLVYVNYDHHSVMLSHQIEGTTCPTLLLSVFRPPTACSGGCSPRLTVCCWHTPNMRSATATSRAAASNVRERPMDAERPERIEACT